MCVGGLGGGEGQVISDLGTCDIIFHTTAAEWN